MIPPGFIQDLINRTDVAEVVGRHVELKRAGANLMGLCPFHGEKSPSFSVSPSKQFYHCFGCGASGDAIKFLTEHLGLSFVEAVRDLAQAAGMTVPEEQVSPEERVQRETLRARRLSLGEVLEKAAAHYRKQLKASPRAIDYLKGRGLSGAIAARFGLGYAPPGWRALASVFAHYDDPLLAEAGLVRLRDGDDEARPDAAPDAGRYDWFRDRVMFPIRAIGGEVIGFGGRVLDDGKPKYINSPETPLFSKGRELYGLFEARQALREKGYALVVEGYMDVVALAQLGFPNAVATLGTACTAEHVQKLFRFTDSVVFSFDGDAAGRRAAARALEAALPHAGDLRSVKFLFLPPEHDPDSFVRERGPQAFEAEVQRALPLSRQLLELAADGQDLDTAEGRARLVAQARPLWEKLPQGALRDQIVGEVATLARLDRGDLARRWGVAGAKRSPGTPAVPRRPIVVRQAARQPQDQVARLLLQRCAWWHELTTADHELLVGLGGWHAELFGWVERWLAEHGPASWTELREPVAVQPWGAAATALVDGSELAVEPQLEELHAAVAQTRRGVELQAAMQVLGRA
ncbi:MAG TPA: DNA primase [Methylibium sp.]|uniref:DNA primase n=1 Tax=Methylibium sp. TaxID=2067992 RepID=UPI002DBD414A|nr:DNA primase [Methylibium sp.]HEU4459166.1 DNA primase [Methylibium sp.]